MQLTYLMESTLRQIIGYITWFSFTLVTSHYGKYGPAHKMTKTTAFYDDEGTCPRQDMEIVLMRSCVVFRRGVDQHFSYRHIYCIILQFLNIFSSKFYYI